MPEKFLKHDGWTGDRTTGHDFFEKMLPDGEILRTHASRSGAKTMSPGRFKAILADQLKLNEAEFWEVLGTRTPATRPSPAPEPAPRMRGRVGDAFDLYHFAKQGVSAP